ncbi:MAG: hypothetical protein U0R80_03560 [Nocardioidaceae bacterium]
MSTWRTKVSDLLRRWRISRYEHRQAEDESRQQRAEDAVERVRKGGDRFPHTGGGSI